MNSIPEMGVTRFPTIVSNQSHIESVVLFQWNGRLATPSFVVKYYSFGSPFGENHNHSIINRNGHKKTTMGLSP